MTRKLFAILGATTLFALGSAGVAQAGGSGPTLQVQPNPVEAGAAISITGVDWCGPYDVTLTLFGPGLPESGQFLAQVTTSGNGALSYDTTAPLTPGLYTVLAEEPECGEVTMETEFNVTTPPTTTNAPTTTTEPPATTEAPSPTEAPTEEPTTTVTDLLPPTGASSAAGPLALVALVLLGAGAILVTRSRGITRG